MSFTSDPLNRACIFACDFKPRVVGGLSVMQNYGRAGGAPKYLTLGDGLTATTFPTPLAGWGASFDGGDYVNTGVVDRYERNDQFSLYFYGLCRNQTDSPHIISTNNGAGIVLQNHSTFKMRLLITAGANSSDYRASKFIPNSINSTCITYNGANIVTSIAGYINTNVVDFTQTGTISGSCKNGRAWHLAVSLINTNYFIGTGYAFGIFDGLISPRDIQLIDRMVRSNIK